MLDKRAFLYTALIFTVAVSIYSALRVQDRAASPPASLTAFLGARWGMSPKEVAEAIGRSSLDTPNTGKRFFEPKPGEERRYQVLMSQGQRFLGRDAEVYFTFKDDKLCMYHIFISDSEEERLDKDVRAYLDRQWGQTAAAPQDDGTTLKVLWQFKDMIVNYWLFEDELALTGPFKAGVGVVYKPIQES